MSSKNVTMKVLLVSFFNDEVYGMRVIHLNLVNNDIDAHMLFFKMPYRRHRSSNEQSKRNTDKNDFTAHLENASDIDPEGNDSREGLLRTRRYAHAGRI